MNQPPQAQKQTGKRIVSKGEYAALVSKKASLWSIGAVFNLASITMISVVNTVMIVRYPELASSIKVALFLLTVSCSFGIREIGKRAVTGAKQVQLGIPLTRANTADLPAPDTLVRASEQPAQEQQAVLLRAASDTQERHEEQLVRASAGGTE